MTDIFFPDYVLEQLSGFGGVAARRMFGGSGLFKGGVMFGLIAEGELYFKCDDSNRADFTAKKSHAFVYEARGRKISLSYMFVPEDVLEEPALLQQWAAKAYDAALKSRKADAMKPKPRRRGPAQPPTRRR